MAVWLALEGMQDDAFEQVADVEVVIFSDPLENLEDALLDPDAGLDALNGLGF